MLRLTSLLALGLMMWVFRLLAVEGSPEAQATLALGFLLLAAYLGGLLVTHLTLPRITGYLLTGLVAGPAVLGLVTRQDAGNLRLISDLAIALIALAAGGELKLAMLREQGRALLRLGAAVALTSFLGVSLSVAALSPWFPLTAGQDLGRIAAIILLLGVMAAVGSPAVTLAVLAETRARGVLARSVLTVVVAMDVGLIVVFAAALSVARAFTGGGHVDLGFALGVGRHIGASILGGLILGWLVSQYLKYVEKQMVLFTLGVALLSVEFARLLDLEAMLLTLTAGFFIENISPVRGERFVRAIEQSGLPIYAVFFALAGVSLQVDALREMWPWALLLVAVRGTSMFFGSRWGGRGVPVLERYAWTGFISQAGVALGLAVVIHGAFPDWGGPLQALVISMIAIQQLVGPVLFRWGLDRAGEIEETAPAESFATAPG